MTTSTFVPSESLSAQQEDQYLYWQLYTMKFYLQRMLANINLIDAPPNALTITVMNTTLFHLAAQYYGDATQWPIIANANGLIDPMIRTTTTLLIPPWNQQDTGGIL